MNRKLEYALQKILYNLNLVESFTLKLKTSSFTLFKDQVLQCIENIIENITLILSNTKSKNHCYLKEMIGERVHSLKSILNNLNLGDKKNDF